MGLRRFRRLPARRNPIPPLAIIVAAGNAGIVLWTPDAGTVAYPPDTARAALVAIAKWRVLSLVPVNIVAAALDARTGELTAWRRGVVAFKLDDGPKIVGTRHAFDRVPHDEAIAEIVALDEWCRDRAVRLSTAGWTGEQLWRSTLAADLVMESTIGANGVTGGRKECPEPGAYPDVLNVDLRAAYPAAMLDDPYPSRLRGTDPVTALTSPRAIGIARATIRIPDDLGPWLPIHHATPIGPWWETGTTTGYYTFRELRAARDAGVHVEVVAAWAGMGWVRPFDRWGDLIGELRAVSPHYGKVIANGLWGIFAMTGETVTYRTDRADGSTVGTVLRRRAAPPPHAGFVAADTTARVRMRLWHELIQRSSPIYVDTDGGMIRAGSPLPEPTGDGIGEWSVRHRWRLFDVRGPQAYAATDYQDREIVVLAGVKGATRADLTRGNIATAMLTTGRYKRDLCPQYRHVETGKVIRLAHTLTHLPPGWEQMPLPLAQ